MSRPSTLVLSVCLSLVLARPTSAQAPILSPAQHDAGPTEIVNLLAHLTERVTELQKRVDWQQYHSERTAAAYVDGVYEAEPGIVFVVGWAGACGFDAPRVVLVVDGVEVPNVPGFFAREQAVTDRFGGCPISPTPGVLAGVVMNLFEPGPKSDNVHTFQFHIYPPKNWPPSSWAFQMAESQIVTFKTSGLLNQVQR